jgi:hypothetical protein
VQTRALPAAGGPAMLAGPLSRLGPWATDGISVEAKYCVFYAPAPVTMVAGLACDIALHLG